MDCKHEKLECTNNVLRCMVCGAVLPLEVLKAAPSVASGDSSPASGGAEMYAAGERFENDDAAENPRKIGFESHTEPAKPRRGRKAR